MEGSPFNSQTEAAKALGLNHKSDYKLISRYLRFGKILYGRYTFDLAETK
jgi:hypothetical protein